MLFVERAVLSRAFICYIGTPRSPSASYSNTATKRLVLPEKCLSVRPSSPLRSADLVLIIQFPPFPSSEKYVFCSFPRKPRHISSLIPTWFNFPRTISIWLGHYVTDGCYRWEDFGKTRLSWVKLDPALRMVITNHI